VHHQWMNLAPSCGRLWFYQYTRPATHVMALQQFTYHSISGHTKGMKFGWSLTWG
jgi:hypothetical protein